MGSRFTLMSEAEYNDYRASLDWYRYSEDDFELTEELDPPARGNAKPATGFVRVHRKSTSVTRSYRVGVPWRWTEDFDRDLWRRAFKGL